MKRILILIFFVVVSSLYLANSVKAGITYSPRTWIESCSVERDWIENAYMVDGVPYEYCPDRKFLSKYIKVDFVEKTPDNWKVCLELHPILWNRLKECYLSDTKLQCLKQIYRDYKDKVDVDLTETQWLNYLQKLKQFPIKKITSHISIDKESIDFTNKRVCLDINFPSGFRIGEKIKLGFMSTTYTSDTQIIRVVGDSTCGDNLANACDFEDIYNADKTNNLTLMDNSTSALNLDITSLDGVRPADNFSIPITLNITVFSGDEGYCEITGTLYNDSTGTENVSFTNAGLYETTNYWKSIDANGIDCAPAGNFGLQIHQRQWGIVWKIPQRFPTSAKPSVSKQYFIDNVTLYIGDDSIPTYFKDTDCEAWFYLGKKRWNDHIVMEKKTWFQIGDIKDSASKTSSDGCSLYFDSPLDAQVYSFDYSGDSTTAFRFYSSSLLGMRPCCAGSGGLTNLTAWNSIFQVAIFQRATAGSEIVRTNFPETLLSNVVSTLDDIYVWDVRNDYGFNIRNPDQDLEVLNLKTRNNTYISRFENFDNSVLNITDADTDTWSLLWRNDSIWSSPGASVLRKYSFDLKVTNLTNDGINSATVDMTPTDTSCESFSLTTGTNGNIATIKVWWGNYSQKNESGILWQTSTLVECNPYNITITATNYETLNFLHNFTEKTKWHLYMNETTGGVGDGIKEATKPESLLKGFFVLGLPLSILLAIVLAPILAERKKS